MKKYLFLVAAIAACMCQSCSDVMTESGLNDSGLQTRSLNEEAEVTTTVYKGENILRFRDMEAYNNVLQRLNSKTNEERIAYTDSLQVESILSLLTKADLELDQLCETSSTEEEFRSKYEIYKDKYDDFFMFNNQDIEDLSAYSKLRSPMDDNIANCNGEYMIGDSLVHSNEFDDFSEFYTNSDIMLLDNETTTINNSTNHAWSHWDKRKVGLYISMETPVGGYADITVRFTAQKKYIFGWKRYSTEYYAEFKLSGTGQGFEFNKQEYMGFPVVGYENKNGQTFDIHTRELSGNETVNLGRVSSTGNMVTKYQYACSGEMYIWSRGIEKAHRGAAKVDLYRNY